MSQMSTVADWGSPVGVSLFTRLYGALRSTWVMVVVDNPLSWKLGYRGGNVQDDIEGPFHIPGAPSRQIEDGKAVLAPTAYIKESGPFLFIFDVKDAKGDPIPNASLNCWQADTEGGYYFATWTLRGKVTADAHGRVEVLSIRPGDYGPPILGRRSGHVHLKINDTSGKHHELTTQVYVCPGNKQEHMLVDMANYARTPRPTNTTTCYSIPAANGGERYWDFPELPAENTEMASRISWWNAKLKERGIDREILAVAQHSFKLSAL